MQYTPCVGQSSSIPYVATIVVANPNDNTPVFVTTGYTFSILEDLPAQSDVGTVAATDADNQSTPQGEIEYSLVGFETQFSIDRVTGYYFYTESVFSYITVCYLFQA